MAFLVEHEFRPYFEISEYCIFGFYTERSYLIYFGRGLSKVGVDKDPVI